MSYMKRLKNTAIATLAKAERPGLSEQSKPVRSDRLSARPISYPGASNFTMPDMMRDYGKTIAGEKLTTYATSLNAAIFILN